MPISPSTPTSPNSPSSPSSPPRLDRRRSSLSETFRTTRLPPGALAATGEAFGRAPSLAELRRSSTASARARRGSSMSIPVATSPRLTEEGTDMPEKHLGEKANGIEANKVESSKTTEEEEEALTGPRHWWGVIVAGLHAFWRYFRTPLGCFVTIYMLNVIAWGGMLFLLICNAAPAMCHPTCDDINSPRRIWIEITSQILNGLFCVTGFGLVPWRFRDLYYLLKWRIFGKKSAYLRLLELKKEWFRPAWEDSEAAAVQERLEEGNRYVSRRAPPTKSWKLDYVIWLYVWNTFFQCVLSGFMWGMDRHERPSWSTGLFVALAFIVTGMAGGQVWFETRRVKKVEEEK